MAPLASVRNLAERLAGEARDEQWTIGFIPKPVRHVLEGFDPGSIRWLPELPDGYLADPFGLPSPGGGWYVFAESVGLDDRQGRIVVFELGTDGSTSVPRPVLDLPVHASYPQLLVHRGVHYCLPETSALGRVQLFRAISLPYEWVPDRVLLEDFPGSDATVFQHEGRWWMLTGRRDDQDQAKLFVFHAPDLLGPWMPHALNPVKCDLRCSRPAGPPFADRGELYRPAQDCSHTYGGAIAINRIARLTPTEFAEETVTVLRPDPSGPYPDGLHTLVGIGNITLVDGKRHVRTVRSVGAALRRLASHALGNLHR